MRIRMLGFLFLIAFYGASYGCGMGGGNETGAVKAVIKRYNKLLIEGYKTLDMTRIKDVTTVEQALKLYNHMSAIGEGKLRMDSTLKDLKFLAISFPKHDEATAVTKEVWDFTHYRMKTGEKFAEEKDFIYEMGYNLKKQQGKWIITGVNVISTVSTNATLPWPELDRQGNILRPAKPLNP